MKLSRVVVLGVALGAGLIAAVLALNLSAPAPAPVVAQSPHESIDTVPVLVAAKDMPMGTTLDAGSVAWRDWPKNSVSAKFITRTSGSDPKPLSSARSPAPRFYDGEPINEAKLIRSDRGFMSAILPEGKRAVATKIAADTSAGGFILPNDRVDVIMTRRADQASAPATVRNFITETILNNVRVLAIDQTIEDKRRREGQSSARPRRSNCTPQQAQILTVAQQMSDRLTLSLCAASPIPQRRRPTPPSDAVHLIGGTKSNGAVTVVRNGVATQVQRCP